MWSTCPPTTGSRPRPRLSAWLAPPPGAAPPSLASPEAQASEIAGVAPAGGAECVVGVDPISLGILAPPGDYGADIVCGDLQALGMHMQFGGGHAGFIATRDEERYVRQFPSRLFGVAPTRVPGEFGFGDVAYERTS